MTEETKEAYKKDWMEMYREYLQWDYPSYPFPPPIYTPCRCNRCPCCGGYRPQLDPYTITWGGTTSVNA